MKVGILCECSGIVREAFRRRGHDAISCDLKPTELAGPHIEGDVFDQDWNGFDLIICHPDCTYLCSSGLHWNKRVPGREDKTKAAVEFAKAMLALPVPRIALENPIGRLGTAIRKADQIIQPWQFGDDASKATCLWLKGLPKLKATKEVLGRLVCCGTVVEESAGIYGCANCNGEKRARRRWANQTDSGQNRLGPGEQRSTDRARTYLGIAEAMADQWGRLLLLPSERERITFLVGKRK